MKLQKYLMHFINAHDKRDYDFLLEQRFSTDEELSKMFAALRSSNSQKYVHGVKAAFEMKTLEKILQSLEINSELKKIRDFNSSGDMHPLLKKAFEDSKTMSKLHLAAVILYPMWNLNIPLSENELKLLLKEFIYTSACEKLNTQECRENCPYGVIWNNHYNCVDVLDIAHIILTEYFGPERTTKVFSEILKEKN